MLPFDNYRNESALGLTVLFHEIRKITARRRVVVGADYTYAADQDAPLFLCSLLRAIPRELSTHTARRALLLLLPLVLTAPRRAASHPPPPLSFLGPCPSETAATTSIEINYERGGGKGKRSATNLEKLSAPRREG